MIVIFELTPAQFWHDLMQRYNGPFSFRFLVQPSVAALLAIRDGIKDARTGRRPYFWTIFTDPKKRDARLVEGLKSTSRVLTVGSVIDVIYQVRVFAVFYPLQMLAIALLLGFVPYLFIRGPVERVMKWYIHRSTPKSSL